MTLARYVFSYASHFLFGEEPMLQRNRSQEPKPPLPFSSNLQVE